MTGKSADSSPSAKSVGIEKGLKTKLASPMVRPSRSASPSAARPWYSAVPTASPTSSGGTLGAILREFHITANVTAATSTLNGWAEPN